MSLETATYISQLNASNPAATDGVNQADDHMRLIKAALLATFPNFTAAALASTNAQLDAAVNAIVNGTVAAVLALGSAGAPTLAFTGDTNTGIYSPGADQVSIATGGSDALQAAADHSVNFPVNAKIAGEQIMSVPIGGSVQWWTDTLPSANWAWVNGQAVSRTTYATLFAKIGTTYGAGDGSTTFNLPDLRDRVAVGQGDMGGAADAARIGTYATTALNNSGGEDAHVVTVAEMPAHNHPGTSATTTASDAGHTHTMASNPNVQAGSGFPASGNVAGGGNTGNITTDAGFANISAATTVTVAFQGGGAAHNNVQPFIVCNHIMRVL